MNGEMAISAKDARLSWLGHVSLEHGANWVAPWRLPYPELAFYPDANLRERAFMSTGVRLAFHSTTSTLKGSVHDGGQVALVDLCINGQYYDTCPFDTSGSFAFTQLPEGIKRLELWLPHNSPFKLTKLIVDSNAILKPVHSSQVSWLTYGSSITQCCEAASPTRTWPSLVALQHNYNLTCLGYGGQCHLDPMIARMIQERRADLISLCIGINIYGQASLNRRTLISSLIGFVKTIREGHPQAPLVVLSPIFCPKRETTLNQVNLSLKDIRDIVCETTEILIRSGDKNLYYVSGLSIFGEQHAHLLPDGIHPNTRGYSLIADNFSRQVVSSFFE